MGISEHFLILIRQKRNRERDLLNASAVVASNAPERTKETLINHNCQMFLFDQAVPEETQLCLVTKLLILSVPLALSLSRSLRGRTRMHARTHTRWTGGCQVISCTKNQLIGASYRDTSPPKDVDLPTENMSRKISIIHGAGTLLSSNQLLNRLSCYLS